MRKRGRGSAKNSLCRDDAFAEGGQGEMMKAFLDANAFDWLLVPRHLSLVKDAISGGLLRVVTDPEVAFEVRRTPDLQKRAALEGVLSLTFPLAPTRLPRLGMARSGLALIATPPVETLHSKLKGIPGADRLDPVHLLNAAAEECHLFVTFDRRLLTKRIVLAQVLGIELISPLDLATRLGGFKD